MIIPLVILLLPPAHSSTTSRIFPSDPLNRTVKEEGHTHLSTGDGGQGYPTTGASYRQPET